MENNETKKKSVPDKDATDETNRLLRRILSKLNAVLTVDRAKSTGIRTALINVQSAQPQLLSIENKDRKKITIKNVNSSSVAVYIGQNSNVSQLTGFTLNQNEQIVLEFHTAEIWALAASATSNVTVVEE